MDENRERRVADAWALPDELPEEELHARIADSVAGAPAAESCFERAAAYDSTGHPDLAVPLYRRRWNSG